MSDESQTKDTVTVETIADSPPIPDEVGQTLADWLIATGAFMSALRRSGLIVNDSDSPSELERSRLLAEGIDALVAAMVTFAVTLMPHETLEVMRRNGFTYPDVVPPADMKGSDSA